MVEATLVRARTLFTNWVYPGNWRRRGLFNAQRSITTPRSREAVASVAGAVMRCVHGRPFSTDLASSAEAGAHSLANAGFVRVGKLLSAAQCDAIAHWLETHPLHHPSRPEIAPFSLKDAPSDCHVAVYPQDTILQCPHLLDIANDPRLLAIAEQFLGAKPTISNLSMWWSLAGRPEPKEAQLFHRDVDDIKFCKLFVYLTDVDLSTGPHVFVRNSPPVDACTDIGRRYQDDEVKAAFGEDAITFFCGERGEAFLANTFGVHKGLLPRSRDRLLFQVQYSLFPIFLYDYSPSTIPVSRFRHDRYVNRLYVRPA